ncbi:hypothetical protein BZM27_05940 [Paraburkholderia steynii]|uniref:Uncharacterized protein n=1 Tax=Paraburkholderia steynii TaxID=1245441 RepID=A0A4R0XRM0_9BURK|nr:hypothetical protein BZM27_05940 [Paraburkholderia steynii]
MTFIAFGVGMIFAYGSVLEVLLIMPGRKPPAPPPTKFRRKYRDLPVADIPPPWERVEGIDYKWINIAGEQE